MLALIVRTNFRKIYFIAAINYENIFTAKISWFTVHFMYWHVFSDITGPKVCRGQCHNEFPEICDPRGRPEVREAIMAAARAAITTHGEELSGKLMAHFEECLNTAPDTHEADTVRQSAVVLMGTLAKHMDKQNPKVSQR